MADSGATFSIDLAVKSEGVQSAADLLDRYAQKLETSSKSAADASAAVKTGETAYKQAETAYDKASKALERINIAMQSANGKQFENLVARQWEAADAVDAARASLNQETIALDRLRTSASAADKQVEALSQAQASAKKAIDASKKSQADSLAKNNEAAESLGKLGGPLGRAGQKALELRGAWAKLSRSIGDAAPYVIGAVGLAVVAAAVAAVAVVLAVGAVHLATWAIGLADASRTSGLLAAGIVQSVAGGEALNSAIDSLAKRVPQTSEKLSSMASELAKTGLRGKELTDTLEKNAIAAAKLEFGPEWQKQMNSLEQQQKRLKAGINGLFSGLKIEKLLDQLSTLVDTFDEGTASGRAIKVVFESLFQPLVDGATGFIPVIRHAFLQFEILSLKALIAIQPHVPLLKKVGEAIGWISLVVLGVFAFAVALLVVAWAGFVALLVLPIVLFAAVAAGVYYLGQALGELGAKILVGLKEAWTKMTTFFGGLYDTVAESLSNVSFEEIGSQIMEGIVGGITAGVDALVTSVKSAATSAITAAKDVLGISSPSKVFAEIGGYTAEGMTQGIESGGGSVEAAMADLVAPPSASAGGPGTGSGGGAPGGGPTGGSVYQIQITAPSGNADDIADKVRQVILDITEGAAIQLGTAVPA